MESSHVITGDKTAWQSQLVASMHPGQKRPRRREETINKFVPSYEAWKPPTDFHEYAKSHISIPPQYKLLPRSSFKFALRVFFTEFPFEMHKIKILLAQLFPHFTRIKTVASLGYIDVAFASNELLQKASTKNIYFDNIPLRTTRTRYSDNNSLVIFLNSFPSIVTGEIIKSQVLESLKTYGKIIYYEFEQDPDIKNNIGNNAVVIVEIEDIKNLPSIPARAWLPCDPSHYINVRVEGVTTTTSAYPAALGKSNDWQTRYNQNYRIPSAIISQKPLDSTNPLIYNDQIVSNLNSNTNLNLNLHSNYNSSPNLSMNPYSNLNLESNDNAQEANKGVEIDFSVNHSSINSRFTEGIETNFNINERIRTSKKSPSMHQNENTQTNCNYPVLLEITSNGIEEFEGSEIDSTESNCFEGIESTTNSISYAPLDRNNISKLSEGSSGIPSKEVSIFKLVSDSTYHKNFKLNLINEETTNKLSLTPKKITELSTDILNHRSIICEKLKAVYEAKNKLIIHFKKQTNHPSTITRFRNIIVLETYDAATLYNEYRDEFMKANLSLSQLDPDLSLFMKQFWTQLDLA